MNWRNRKVRIAIVLAIAMIAAFVAWRTSTPKEQPACVPGRAEVKDASGKVTEIKRTTCMDEAE
ncbi:MAG: hypothetical protein KF730_08265 [Sphingomonas sp.]|uniref:hypothetical protein n=1 Tax=Sphingomonas sp. TaxID=28214 RepID=UPI0025FBA63A|nr:hypothetical protein [Sphingomonas sp.]MBX3564554.1 hypothetical protein [Sphingomonas sp.]